MTARRALAESVDVTPGVAEAAYNAARRATRGYLDESVVEAAVGTARRGQVEEVPTRASHLSVVPTVRRGYVDDTTDVRGIFVDEAPRNRMLTDVRPMRALVEDDTVILKRVVSAPVSIHAPAPRKRSTIKKIIAPLGVAVAATAVAYGGVANNVAAATDFVPQTEAAVAAARTDEITSRNIVRSERVAPQTQANSQLGDVTDALQTDTIVQVDTTLARELEEARLEAERLEAERIEAERIAAEVAAEAKRYYLPVNVPVNSNYGYRVSPFGYGEFHDGVDMATSCGTPVAAAQSGTVASAQWDGGYGYRVMIKHADGVTTGYAHLQSMAVSPGQYVNRGQLVGGIGSTGLSTGCHLHYMANINGQSINPMGL